MKDEDARPGRLSRRRFLMACGALAVGGCFSGINPRAVLAESRRTGKPILTDAQFNTRLASLRGRQGFRPEIEEMKRDLLAYLDRRYNLTAQQRAVIGRLPQAQRVQLNASLDRAVQQNLAVKLQIRVASECRELRLGFGFTQQELMITAFA